MMDTYDLIAIGGGRASALAIAAAKAGWRTALIEKDKLGGTCPNRGCVPSKLLIGFSEVARTLREAENHFIDAQLNGIDLPRLFDSVSQWTAGVDGRYEGRIKDAGVELIRAEGRFIGPKTIQAGDRTLKADKIVIATGSRPVWPKYSDLPIWTSDQLFPLDGAPPKSLSIIGGGVIATEMASFFAGVGTHTRLFARGDRLLKREDTDIENVFRQEFQKSVETYTNAPLTDLTHDGKNFAITVEIDGESQTFESEQVLFATGRRPNSEGLDLENTGLAADRRGFVPVNDHLETEVPGIYAVGDINGRFMLQHAASHEVFHLRQSLLNDRSEPIDERLVAHAIYSHPEVAAVGITEEQAKAQGVPYVAVWEDWQASARAMAQRTDYHRTKLIVSPEDHSILGCHLVGPESSTLLHQVLAVMRLKNDVRELANMIYIHPALNEALLAAAVKAVSAVKKHNAAS